jgi:hypothetical protein
MGAGRPPKLTEWTLTNALEDARRDMKSIRQVARELHVHPDTTYASAKRLGIDIPSFLRDFPAKCEESAPNNGELGQVHDVAPISEPTSVKACAICQRPMPHTHAVDPAHHGMAPSQRPSFDIAMSYAPKRRGW